MPVSTSSLEPDTIVDRRWKVLKVLGSGAFGAVYEVKDLLRNSNEAMKVEMVSQDFHTLKMEVVVLNDLTERKARNVCHLWGVGRKPEYCYIVMTLVGPSLFSLLDSIGGRHFDSGPARFTMRSVVHLGIMCLQALEDLHNAGYLHRDIKPQNFAIGRDPDYRKVYLLDFGMSRKFIRKDGTQKRPRAEVGFRGTLFYASHYALKGEEQSRRDDLWSWFFTIIQLATGRLPWYDVRVDSRWSFEDRREAFANRKERCINSSKNELVRTLPPEFKIILDGLKILNYYDKPNYMLYYGAFQNIMLTKGYDDETPLDWEPEGEYREETMMAPVHDMMFGNKSGSKIGSKTGSKDTSQK